MFTIGQFSRITGLTIKTIRLYQERGLLCPAWVDGSSSYRYYDARSVERARAVVYLRELQFSLSEIREILDSFQEDSDTLAFLERQRQMIQEKLNRLGSVALSLDGIIRTEKEAAAMLSESRFTVSEKEVPDMLVAGLRWKGRYDETGRTIQQVGKLAGRYIRGKPLNLYYDGEYKDEGADIESCFPVGEMTGAGALSVHRLPGGRCAYLIHKGPYDQLGRSYARLMEYLQKRGYEAAVPIREVYLKGPGMIFRGNPRNYLTEIQIMIENRGEAGHDEGESGTGKN